ncbi:uncharacterized protein LOC130430492 isoform X2 [Triplophysa dalaica]|uniref:uncharacterized protein LOC130430492 isoform X2 n=1 Tax=Triplophysa dalaica TaxID=1582913 RepID=UPI0024DF8A95|nr:uncharacterized protein LOC130430492 isoform X2 [Triplophysa dalaica]
MLYTSLVLCSWTLIGVFGDEVKSVSVMEGHSVTLHTDLTHIQTNDEIEWRFKDILIARIKRSVNINPIYNNDKTEIFRDRLKMNNQTGDLNITHITSQHSGLYHLLTIINNKLTKKNFSLNVNASTAVSISESTQTPSSSSSSSPLSSSSASSVQIVVISCVTAVVGCVMIGAALLFICRKHTNTQQEDQTHDKQNICCDSTFFKHNTQDSEMTEVLYTYYNISTN